MRFALNVNTETINYILSFEFSIKMDNLDESECLYNILGVSKDASVAEIRKSYQELILIHHPDKSSVYSDSGSSEFMKIDRAWKVLRDPELRKLYDADAGQKEFNDVPIVNESLTMDKMDFDGEVYERPCRCGGSYVIDKDELVGLESNFYINCSECSLVIEIIIKAS